MCGCISPLAYLHTCFIHHLFSCCPQHLLALFARLHLWVCDRKEVSGEHSSPSGIVLWILPSTNSQLFVLVNFFFYGWPFCLKKKKGTKILVWIHQHPVCLTAMQTGSEGKYPPGVIIKTLLWSQRMQIALCVSHCGARTREVKVCTSFCLQAHVSVG